MLKSTSLVVKPEIIVMGAGAAGVCAALELARRGHSVKLIEKKTLFSGASGSNPGRQGHGFHYTDIETSLAYLRESIRLQRAYPNYLIGRDKPFDDPIRHGRYFITKDSTHTKEDILATYQEIKKEYVRLVREDSENEVFGPPESFFRILDSSEYCTHVNMDTIDVGVETAEHLFDWQAFAADRKQEILDNPNITLFEHAEVVHIERGAPDANRFILSVKNTLENCAQEFSTDYLINSTWAQIQALNDMLGIRMVPGERTNRLKCLLVVKLPESLQQVNSMFFCMGKHCMFTNLGNGYGMLTYADVTNMEVSDGLELKEFSKRVIDGGATDAEQQDYSKQILQGVSKYIPDMLKATIVELRFGIVQTNGQFSLDDLNDPTNSIQKRNYHNVIEARQGVINNPAVKLSNCVQNGERVADLVAAQIVNQGLVDNCFMKIEQQYKDTYKNEMPRDIRRALYDYLGLYSSSTITSALLDSAGLFECMRIKKSTQMFIGKNEFMLTSSIIEVKKRLSISSETSDSTVACSLPSDREDEKFKPIHRYSPINESPNSEIEEGNNSSRGSFGENLAMSQRNAPESLRQHGFFTGKPHEPLHEKQKSSWDECTDCLSRCITS